MKVFVCVDIVFLEEIDRDLIKFFGYDRGGWIKESMQELIALDSTNGLRSKEILARAPRYKFSRSFPVFMDENLIGTFDLIVQRLKQNKKPISRNILLGESIRRKLAKSVDSRKSKINSDIVHSNEKIVFGIRVDPGVLGLVRKLVSTRKEKMRGYTISSWIEESIDSFFIKGRKHIPSIKHNICSKTARRVSVICSKKNFERVQGLVAQEKLKNSKFSRNELIYEMIIQRLIDKKSISGREILTNRFACNLGFSLNTSI